MAFGAGHPEPVDVAVGARIRVRRRQIGWSQTQLANGVAITFQQIQKYERGSNRVSASMLVKIAALLDTTVAALVGEDGSEPYDVAVYAQLAMAGASEMVEAYCLVGNPEVRSALVLLARALSRGPRPQEA